MRCQVIAAPRLYTQPFARSYSASRNDDDGDAGSDGGKLMDSIKADIEAGGMTLDERLQDMGLDAAEYKQLWKSQQASEKRFEKWEPTTRSEAEQRWKEMQNTPDHLTLLQMYKKAGIEPIKLAKCVAPVAWTLALR
jgi:small subunit ribosomal protein S10